MSVELEPVRIVFSGYRVAGRKLTEHDGAFPSVNDIGTPGDTNPNWGYKNAKALLSEVLASLLCEPSGTEHTFIKPGTQTTKVTVPIERDGELPHPIGAVLVEGTMWWPGRQVRDQFNYAAIVWKFLGDVLVEHGYLSNDDWTRYQCGNLTRGWEKGRPARTELILFPRAEPFELLTAENTEGALF